MTLESVISIVTCGLSEPGGQSSSMMEPSTRAGSSPGALTRYGGTPPVARQTICTRSPVVQVALGDAFAITRIPTRCGGESVTLMCTVAVDWCGGCA